VSFTPARTPATDPDLRPSPAAQRIGECSEFPFARLLEGSIMSALRSSPSSKSSAVLSEPSTGSLLLIADERRRRPRSRAESIAMAVFSRGEDARQLTPIRITDTSLMGLGALSPVAVAPGSSFSLLHETGCAPRQVGQVVRCEPEGNYFRIGLRGRTLHSSN
jgi:hypothetical protein